MKSQEALRLPAPYGVVDYGPEQECGYKHTDHSQDDKLEPGVDSRREEVCRGGGNRKWQQQSAGASLVSEEGNGRHDKADHSQDDELKASVNCGCEKVCRVQTDGGSKRCMQEWERVDGLLHVAKQHNTKRPGHYQYGSEEGVDMKTQMIARTMN